MEGLYNFEKKEKEIASLTNKNMSQRQLTEEKHYQRNMALGASLSLVGITLLVLFFHRKTRKQKLALEVALSDKNILLQETHHRIKNSFQMVSSLLYLQSENMEDKRAALAVKDGQNRVKSMALIHQKLYQKENLIGIDTEEYITDLVQDIFESYRIGKNTIDLELDVDALTLEIETITSLGLIINELITNILKHAFVTKIENPKMEISFKDKKEFLMLRVKDNGVGFDKNKIKSDSFGLKLISSLANKVKAKIDFFTNNGSEVQIKIYKYKTL